VRRGGELCGNRAGMYSVGSRKQCGDCLGGEVGDR
jgi:hypothetical protein